MILLRQINVRLSIDRIDISKAIDRNKSNLVALIASYSTGSLLRKCFDFVCFFILKNYVKKNFC